MSGLGIKYIWLDKRQMKKKRWLLEVRSTVSKNATSLKGCFKFYTRLTLISMLLRAFILILGKGMSPIKFVNGDSRFGSSLREI